MTHINLSALTGIDEANRIMPAAGLPPIARFNDWSRFDLLTTSKDAAVGPTLVSDERPMVDFPAVFNLATLDGINGFRIDGSFGAGESMSSAGDVNRDGFDDILIGGYRFDKSYVVLGKANGFGERFDLATLDGSNGIRLDGVRRSDNSGYSVSDAGDVNGDGFDDIIIGARYADPDGVRNAGESYVVFGRADVSAASINLDTLDGSNGFRLDGSGRRDSSGFAVSGAGDVNGDGFDDIIVGAPDARADGARYAGKTYLVFGKAGAFDPSIDLAALDGSDGFRLTGVSADDASGRAVSSAGDLNGDGFDDILIGAYKGDPGGIASAGESYVVFGKADGFAAKFNLADLDGSNGFRLDGVATSDRSGRAVSLAGDVNGDGFDDILIGAEYAGPGGRLSAGVSYVVFGKSDGFAASFALATLDGSNGFRLDGLNAQDKNGHSVSSAGDVNGDGFDDIVVSAFRADPGGVQGAGEIYVVFGKAGGFAANIDLASLDGGNGFRVEGAAFVDYTGVSVSSAGDINGDGFDEILIGSINAGAADTSYLIFGRAPTEAVRRNGSEADQEIRGGASHDTLSGRGGDDTLAGGGARDRLKGGAGADAFVLDDDLDDGDRATILDFTSGEDVFAIDADDFGGGLTPGGLDSDAFAVNSTGQAGDADDRLIYNSAKGLLFYDADGSGAGERVLLAKLTDAPTIVASDFIVI